MKENIIFMRDNSVNEKEIKNIVQTTQWGF